MSIRSAGHKRVVLELGGKAPMVVLDGRQLTTDALLTLWFLIAMIAYRERRPLLFSAASC